MTLLRHLQTRLHEMNSSMRGLDRNNEPTTQQLDGVPNAMVGDTNRLGSTVPWCGGYPPAAFVGEQDEVMGRVTFLSGNPTVKVMESKQVKRDQGKAPVEQGLFAYFPRALLAVANVSRYGSEKYQVPYTAKAWKVGNEVGRFEDAQDRHILNKYIEGAYDVESHLLHLSHEAWGALATLELALEAGTPERDPNA